jgi:hypothetical protein
VRLVYEKKLRRFTFTNDKGEVWRNYQASLIRLLLKHGYGMNRQQITQMMAQAKCLALGI